MRTLLILLLSACVLASPVEIVNYEDSTSAVDARLVISSASDVAVELSFTGSPEIHYYADSTAGVQLSARVVDEKLANGKTIYPLPSLYVDSMGQSIDVYEGNFKVYLPVSSNAANDNLQVLLTGNACAGEVCFPPFNMTIDVPKQADFPIVEFAAQPASREIEGGSGFNFPKFLLYCLLSIVAGLSFNIMPCVWPVLPIAVQRLVNFAGDGKKKLLEQGLAYAIGIVGFFAIFAVAGIIIKLTTGNSLNWSEHLRYPPVLISLGMLLIFFALFMFEIFQFAVPAGLSGGNNKAKGEFSGTLVTGFFAALLSTPCSGAILAAVFLWAQTQNLFVSTVIILLLGVGMAIPYVVLVNFPAFLSKLPKPGNWMVNFRKAMGFVLLFIAVKMLSSLSDELMSKAYYYAVFFALAIWIFGTWAPYGSSKAKKMKVRILAIIIAVLPAFVIFQADKNFVDWNDYNQTEIEKALADGQTVLIKFTADWCTNCHSLDNKVFKKRDTADKLGELNVYPVLGDTTVIDMPASKALEDVYGEAGNVPLTVILKPNQQPIKLRGIYSKNVLFDALQ